VNRLITVKHVGCVRVVCARDRVFDTGPPRISLDGELVFQGVLLTPFSPEGN